MKAVFGSAPVLLFISVERHFGNLAGFITPSESGRSCNVRRRPTITDDTVDPKVCCKPMLHELVATIGAGLWKIGDKSGQGGRPLFPLFTDGERMKPCLP